MPLLVGVAVILLGCGAPDPSDAFSQEATERSASKSAPESTASSQTEALQAQLRQAGRSIEAQHNSDPNLARGCIAFPLVISAPTDLSGFTPEPVKLQDLNSLGASATVRLTGPGATDHWMDFWQGMGCYGALLPPPEGAKDIVAPHAVQVPGLNSAKAMPQVESWTQADGSKSVTLRWYSDVTASPNISYSLMGHNVDAATLIRIAGSVESVP